MIWNALQEARAFRRITIAAIVSIVAHIAFFLAPMKKPELGPALSATTEPPLNVRITQPAQQPPPQLVERFEPVDVPRPTPLRTPSIDPNRKKPTETAKTVEPTLTKPPAEPVDVPTPAPPTPTFDMAALIAANREKRRSAEAAAARGPSSPAEASPDQVAMANINRNLQSMQKGGEGTSGVFEILFKGHRNATFAFNGWKTDAKRQWREVIEVDAGQGGDVELAIVRRMIVLIREHYSGDFNWESRRVGRVVVLSARPADTAELETFMVKEFFDTVPVRRTLR